MDGAKAGSSTPGIRDRAMKNRSLLDSFNNALQGVIHALRTERNVKIHFLAAFAVLILALFYRFTPIELLILIATSTLVIVTELFNTAVEAIVDLVCGEKKHPLAKVAKDVSAGAVFITSMNALIVAYVLFYTKIERQGLIILHRIQQLPIYITLISILLVILSTIVLKTLTGHTKPFQGGMPSGHSSLAFACATCIAFLTDHILAISLAYFLALLVAQSRVEGKIHTLLQTMAGALLGTLITILIFQLFL